MRGLCPGDRADRETAVFARGRQARRLAEDIGILGAYLTLEVGHFVQVHALQLRS